LIWLILSTLKIGLEAAATVLHKPGIRCIPGIFILNSDLSIGQNIEELILIAEGSFDDEYQDRIIHLPLT